MFSKIANSGKAESAQNNESEELKLYQNKIKELQEKNKKLEKANKEKDFELKSEREDNRDYKEQIKKIKYDNFQLKEENKKVTLTYKEQMEAANKNINELNSKINTYEDQMKENEKYVSLGRKLFNENKRLENEINCLKIQLANTKRKLKYSASADYKEKITSANETIHSLKIENSKLKQFQKSYIFSSEECLANAMEAIEKYIEVNNFSKYRRRLMKIINKMEELNEKKKLLEHSENETALDIEKSETFGFIIDDNGTHFFSTFENKIYKTSMYQPPYVVLDGDTPAKAFINDNNEAYILKTYDYEEEAKKKETGSKIKADRIKEEVEKERYEKMGDFKVLIVSDMKKDEYIEELKKYEIPSKWIDPVDANMPEILKDAEKYDIIILCKRHIPHKINDYLSDYAYKTSLLDKDNKQYLVARVRYMAVKLDIIMMNNGKTE